MFPRPIYRIECPNCRKLLETPRLSMCYNCGAPLEEVWRRGGEPWPLWRTVAWIMLAVITGLGLAYLFLQFFRASG